MKQKMTRDAAEVVKLHATPDAMLNIRNVRYGLFHDVYPNGLVRSLTSKTRKGALSKGPDEVVTRGGTTEPAWCLVPMRFVVVPTNDLGDVSP